MRQGLRERPTRRYQTGCSGQSDTWPIAYPAGHKADSATFAHPDADATATDADADTFVHPDAAAAATDAYGRSLSIIYADQDLGTSGNSYPRGTETRNGPRSLRDNSGPVRQPHRDGKPRTISVIPATFDPDAKTNGAKTELTG
jgi:hypothetical protein